MLGHAMGLRPARVTRSLLAQALKPVIDSLEARRLLSADGVEELLDEPVESYPEEYVYMTLMVEEGEAGEGGEPRDIEDGEVWDGEEIYLMNEVAEDGEMVDGEIIDGEEIYTTTVFEDADGDGEADPVDLGEAVDLDGDGEPDVIYYTTTSTDGDPDEVTPISKPVAVAKLKKNGTLTVKGTNGDDNISLDLNAQDEVVVTINGKVLGRFDADSVEKIKISGLNGDDHISVDEDLDIDAKIRGQAGDDTCLGGAGNDKITGGGGKDDLDGRAGDDRVRGGKGDDDVKGGNGTDDLLGGRGLDKVKGGRGGDALRGGHGKDKINAGKGNDFIDGGEDLDQIVAGEGIDGCDDKSGDQISDEDNDDKKFSESRLAAPFWWSDGAIDAICHIDFPDCNDTPDTGDMPIWWNPEDGGGDGDGTDSGDLAQRIDPSQYPDGNYPDDTPGSDEELI